MKINNTNLTEQDLQFRARLYNEYLILISSKEKTARDTKMFLAQKYKLLNSSISHLLAWERKRRE